MEVLDSYNTSVNVSRTYGLDTNSTDGWEDNRYQYFVYVMQWIIICVGLPLTLLAIFAVYALIKTDHSAPVFIINLLFSDLIQFCCLIAWKANIEDYVLLVYFFGVISSIGFMVCISLERYLAIAQPLWYRFRRNIKTAVVICVIVWCLPLAFVIPLYCDAKFHITAIIMATILLLPFPLFIFFLGGTIRALSTARSVPAEEKRRIVAILVVVLLTYTMLFLPFIIWVLVEEAGENDEFFLTSLLLLTFSPLADLTMYIFIRKGAIDKLLASLCCCKMGRRWQSSSMTNDSMSVTCSQTV